MKKLIWPLALLVLQPFSTLGCRGTQVGAPQPATTPAEIRTAVPATADYIPEGTMLRTRLNQELSTKTNVPGDRFTVTIVQDVVASNGAVAIPAGSLITGTVATMKKSSHVGEQAAVELRFDTVGLRGTAYPMSAQIVEADVKQSHKGSNIAKGAGGGALGGAALGAILGGGSGALKGGLIGAGAGTLISLGVGDVDARLPEGSLMTLRLTSPVDKR